MVGQRLDNSDRGFAAACDFWYRRCVSRAADALVPLGSLAKSLMLPLTALLFLVVVCVAIGLACLWDAFDWIRRTTR